MKFIITVTGPAMIYRLDLLKKSSPDIIKDYIIIFTDEYSLPLYKDYHDIFTFVTMDKIRENYPISLQYEQFLNVPTEEELWAGLLDFYNGDDKKLYPYDIHRFIMPYMAEQNILNFTIIDSDMMFRNSPEMIKSFFELIPPGTTFMPWFGEDGLDARSLREPFIQQNAAPYFPQINFNRDSLRVADGFVRGFHFKNKEDIMLYFNLWNTSLEKIYTTDSNWISGNVILDLNWLSPYLMQFFESIEYTFVDHNKFQYQNKLNTYRHVTRPEDTFYFGERSGWLHHNFNYSDTTNISSFIKNNKNQLEKYYNDFLDVIEITDTHCYTKLRNE
jgi:hypothetical protein